LLLLLPLKKKPPETNPVGDDKRETCNSPTDGVKFISIRFFFTPSQLTIDRRCSPFSDWRQPNQFQDRRRRRRKENKTKQNKNGAKVTCVRIDCRIGF
jgi:hypothetical protein